MRIRVVYTTQLKSALGISTEEVELADGGRLTDLVSDVADRHKSKLAELLIDAQGQLLPSIVLCVNDEQTDFAQEVPLSDNDEVTILSAISGG